ncbi:MAG: tetratricopeptide repeat protein [Ignavibacteria bacterium]
MKNNPTGNVTFLFTDIESSTQLAQEFPDSHQFTLRIHNKILTEAIESHNGFIFKTIGDAFCAAFQNAGDAVKAAVSIQTGLASAEWKDAVIKVRIGIHSGQAEWIENNYSGYITLARTARVMSSSYGEQIIISVDVFDQIPESELVSNNYAIRDLGERRLKDVIKPIRLYQVIAPGLREEFPPLKTLDARPNNLPLQLTNFIGRENELTQVKKIFADSHLLTITGSGGSGKSRLALQTGADLIDDFVNGVWLTELASVSDPELIPQTIIESLGIKEEPNETPEKILIGFLKDKEILIILDNCEHLIDACAALTENLLTYCPMLKILATSREALKCRGEHLFRIPTLSHPEPDSDETPEQLSQYESVRLFIERALSLNPAFRVNNDNAPALAAICSRLDGIPLAIELAAARTKILSLEKIHERLDDRFSLLTGGKRTALPRQQTLRALIDYSYDLLENNEKILWSRLSVFSDGWTLEEAEEICSDDTVDKYEIIDLLSNLAEKSIILFDEINERYNILETIKQYGKEKLTGSEIILSKHLHYFKELAGSAEPELRGKNSKYWLDKLEAEYPNIKSAVEWSLDEGEIEDGVSLVNSLFEFWRMRGYYFNEKLLLEKFLINREKLDKSSLADVLITAGSLANIQGNLDYAQKLFTECLTLSKELNDKSKIASSIGAMGFIESAQGNNDKARILFEESLALKRELGNRQDIATDLNNLGVILCDIGDKGDFDQAQKYLEECLTLLREISDVRGLARSLGNLAILSNIKGDYNSAKNLYEESLEMLREIGDQRGISRTLNYLSIVARNLGEYDEERKYIEECYEIISLIGDKRGTAIALNNLGETELIQKNFEKAKKYIEESLVISKENGYKNLIARSLNYLGTVTHRLGDNEHAKKLFKESLQMSIELEDKYSTAEHLNNFAGMLSEEKDNPLNKVSLESLESLESLVSIESIISILSSIETTIQSMGIVFERFEQTVYDNALKNLRKKFSEEEFNTYWEKGKKMTLEEACRLVM